MAMLLLFTASVTPFEVAFLETNLDPLFAINRVVDLLFLLVRARAFLFFVVLCSSLTLSVGLLRTWL